jgi:mannose-6-phosphate isomerase
VDVPLRFVPFLRPLVWGGRQMGEVLGKPLPTDQAYGESWEVSDHALHASVVAEGPHEGQTLRQLMQHHRDALLGPAAVGAGDFPWLVKLLDAWDWLSVQVHPPEHLVGRLWPGENSKTEAWFILAAAPSSRIYTGLLPGVDEARLRAALRAGTVAECLHSFVPQPGDCVFLPAGTVHAVGGGVLLAEVQQSSDATFRLFDWDRVDVRGQSRALHVEEAIACIDWNAGPVHPVRASGYPAPGKPAPAEPVRQELVRCRYFVLEYLRGHRPFPVGGGGCLQVLVVLHGKAALETPQGQMPFRVGDTLLLPADMKSVYCRPEGPTGLLLSSLPSSNCAAICPSDSPRRVPCNTTPAPSTT